MAYDYDLANNRTQITYPTGSPADRVDYTFDVLNRMDTVSASWLSGFTQYTYDDAGRLDYATLPSSTGVTLDYGYDTANRLTSVTNTKAGAPPTTLSSYTYVPNPNGNRTQVTDTTGGVTTYGYDALDRLTNVQYPEGDCQAYTYDAVGNRLTLTATPKVTLPCDGTPSTVTTTYNQVDEIKTITGVTGAIPYDKNGNLITIGTPVGTPSSETFLYDQENRLFRTGPCRGDFNNDGTVNPGDQALLASRVSAIEGTANYDLLFDLNADRSLNPGDQALTSAEVGRQCHNTGANTGNERNWYNGDGLRVRARTFPNGAGAVDDDATWDVGAGLPVTLVGRRTQSGVTTTTRFVYGLGLISTTDNTGAASYYLADGLGSTTQLVDSVGALTGDAYTYDVFGAPRTVTGTTANDFRFTGQQTDAKANRGLQYLRARHYDPALGRFLGRDPVWSGNRYVYAGNNPVNYADPSGQCRVDVALRVGGSSGNGLLDRLFGSAAWYHAFIVTADPITGEKTLFEGRPDGGWGPLKMGATLKAGGGPFALGLLFPDSSSNAYASARRKTVFDDGGSCGQLNGDLALASDAINSKGISYKFARQNSNSVASELLESVGIVADKPAGNAPGWGRNLIDALFNGAVRYQAP